MPPRPRWRRAWRSSGNCIVIVSFLGGATLEEVAVEGELADQGIDLAERERRRRMALEVAADDLVGAAAEIKRDGTGVVDGRGAMFAGERQQALEGRDAVVRRGDFNAAVEVDGAGAEGVVAKRGRGKRLEVRALLGEHRGDLPLRRAVDPGVGPPGLPVVEIGLRGRERLEAQALER